MNKRIAHIMLLAVVLLWPHAASADENALPRLFPKKAAVTAPHDKDKGMTQLQLPEAVQRAVKPDLSDVRLIDQAGNEVPYLVDSSALPWRQRRDTAVTQYASLERVARSKSRNNGQSQYHEELTVERPAAEHGVSGWTLYLNSAKRRFVAKIRIVDDAFPERVLVEGSFYRLRDPLREGLTLPLPRKLPEKLRVIIDSEDGYLEPTANYRGRQPHELAQRGMPLTIRSQSSEHGVTTLVVERPRGVQPLALDVDTGTGTFHRVVTVLDSGPGGGDRQLGGIAIFRVAELPGVTMTRIPLATPSGDQLTLRIDDRDSPALTEIKVVAMVEPPTLLFDAPGPLTLLFGGGRAHRPRYDLAALAGSTPLTDFTWLDAEVGEIKENEAFDPSPALAFLLRPGAQLDDKAFAHRRPLTIVGAHEGVSKLRLDATDLAASRNGLLDLRIVDKEGRQYAYLLEQAQVHLKLAAEISQPMVRTTGTHYRISLPASPLAVSALELKTDASLVQREFKLVGKRLAVESVLAQGSLSRQPGRLDPLVINFGSYPQDELELVISDGGDASLLFSGVSLTVPSADVYVAAPDGSYWLLLGNADASEPSYELTHARELALALPAPTITVGPIEKNPNHEPPVEDPTPTRVMWAVLVAAVLLLGGLTFRAARERDPKAPPAEGEAARDPTDTSKPAPTNATEPAAVPTQAAGVSAEDHPRAVAPSEGAGADQPSPDSHPDASDDPSENPDSDPKDKPSA